MTRVLVTGASGFLGRELVPRLIARGFDVHATTSRTPPRGTSLQWHQVDLFDTRATATLLGALRPATLVHLAWETQPPQFWSSPENVRWMNASHDLAAAFQASGGQRLVCAGTCAEYRWDGAPCSESSTPLAPTTLYGASKLSSYHLLQTDPRTSALGLAWGRLFHLYGPGEHPSRLVAAVIRSCLAGSPYYVGAPHAERDYLHIGDAAERFAELAGGTYTGVVNVASGRPISIGRLAAAIARRLDSIELLQFACGPVRGAKDVLVADVRHATTVFGGIQARLLEAGLDDAITWWREQGAMSCHG